MRVDDAGLTMRDRVCLRASRACTVSLLSKCEPAAPAAERIADDKLGNKTNSPTTLEYSSYSRNHEANAIIR